MLVLVSCSGLEAGDGALDVVARTDPRITAVHTDDGFTEIRQNAFTSIVIAGKRLADTTSVSVGELFVTIDSVTDDEVRATVFSESPSPGRLDVSVTTGTGTAIMPRALALTPFVVSPAAVTGHGTFQSPMSLCDPEFELTGNGSTVQLLAGTHHCDRQIILGAGSIVLGDRDGGTIVTGTETGGFGFAIWFGNLGSVTTIRNVTFQAPLAAASIELNDGNLVVERVVDAGGIAEFGDGSATIDHYTYVGEGTGLELQRATVTHSTIRHCGTGDGIHVAVGRSSINGNNVILDDVVVEDCQRGLVVGAPSGQPVGAGVQVLNSRFVDNAIGILIQDGFTFLQDTVIRGDEATPRASSVGIQIERGDASMSGGKITDQTTAGIQVFGSNGSSDSNTTLDVEGVLIAGGKRGIDFGGVENDLFLHGSTIRGQTEAAVRISAFDSFIVLGSTSDPGGNALSVQRGGFALDDARSGTQFFDRYILAVGTTLNGVSFDGQTIEGPAELAPYYRLPLPDSGLQF
jgi:hypothetical protein